MLFVFNKKTIKNVTINYFNKEENRFIILDFLQVKECIKCQNLLNT